MKTADEIAILIAETRQRAGLSQKQLARAMGTTQSTIARLEAGKRNPTLTTLRRIAAATGNQVIIELKPQ